MILPVDKQKKILFNVLVILLFKANKTQNKSGVLFVFEDLHWSDPTSLEFVHFLCDHPLFSNGHMSIVMTSRTTTMRITKSPWKSLSKLPAIGAQKRPRRKKLKSPNEEERWTNCKKVAVSQRVYEVVWMTTLQRE